LRRRCSHGNSGVYRKSDLADGRGWLAPEESTDKMLARLEFGWRGYPLGLDGRTLNRVSNVPFSSANFLSSNLAKLDQADDRDQDWLIEISRII
jgi:hypothetical protein